MAGDASMGSASEQGRAISRRAFLAGAAATVGALGFLMAHATTEAEAAGERVARFIIGSDLHVPHYGSTDKIPAALQWMSTMGPDRICLVGDVVDAGLQIYYDRLLEILDESPFASEIQDRFVFCQGNHETYGPGPDGAPRLFTKNMGQEPNKLLSVNGVPVITMGPNTGSESNYADNAAFLSASFDEIDADPGTYAPGMPILVLCHHAIQDTVYTSSEWYGSYGDCIPLLQAHPRVIHVSGHSHATVEDPRSIDQSLGFTCLQDSTLGAYYECERHDPEMYDRDSGSGTSSPKTGSDRNKASQCLVLDVMATGDAIVTRYDLYPLVEGGEARQLYESWTIETSQMAAGIAGFPKDRTSSARPTLPESGSLDVTEIGSSSVTLTFPAFPAASEASSDMVHDYRVEALPVDADGNASGDAQVRRYFGDYYLPPEQRRASTGEPFKVKVASLGLDTSYRLSVFAETPFAANDAATGVSEPLELGQVVTTGTSVVPDAIVDVDFRLGSAADAMGHALSDKGGSLAADDTLYAGSAVSVFESDGEGGFGYKLSDEDFGFMAGASTAECLFKLADTAGEQCLFSCQQSAGVGFEVEDGTLAYYFSTGGSYQTPSCPVEAGTWVHALAVSDGTNVTLYVNGQLAAQVAGGAMDVPKPKTIYVGCDTGASGDPQLPSRAGTRIAFARLYPRAFTAEEVAAAWEGARTAPDGIVFSCDYRTGSATDECGALSTLWDGSRIQGATLPDGSSGLALAIAGGGGYSYALDENVFNRLAQVSSTECLFKMAEVDADQCVFSDQQLAGSGLEVKDGNLEFWINLSNLRNPKPKAAIAAGEWVHAVATFDGASVCLYVNGRLAEQKSAGRSLGGSHVTTGGSGSGTATMRIPGVKSYFVGADPSLLGKPEYMCKAGTQVAFARLYARVLTPEEIAASYQALVDPTAASGADAAKARALAPQDGLGAEEAAQGGSSAGSGQDGETVLPRA